jgi:hypothetical protein
VLASRASAEEWLSGTVYFIDCGTETRADLTLQNVREHADCKREFGKDLKQLLDVLQLHALRPNPDTRPQDPRIVIDLLTDAHARVTYYCDGGGLQTADNRYWRRVDQRFCDQLHHLVCRHPK